jgi:prephenate dehydrogenase
MTAPSFFPDVTIVGVGLIGGSLAKVMKAKNLAGAITGTGRSKASLEQALRLGVIDRGDQDARHAVEQADLVILASPVNTFAPIVRQIGSHIKSGAILTDVGSVKGGMVRTLEDLLPPGVHFVPGHPIAGREQHGVTAATETLFRGAKCILTPTVRTDARALDVVTRLWTAAGASVMVMDPDLHDHVFAAVSHMPHVAAFAMMNAVAGLGSGKEQYLQFSGAGFRDFTRIAASSPEMWRDICLLNAANIVDMIDRYQSSLDRMKRAIQEGAAEEIEGLFKEASDVRRGMQ